MKDQHKIVLEKHHRRFHPIWGQLLKTGYQNSRFAHQVERFACLYTSHVSNLTFYSPEKSFRSGHAAWSGFWLWRSVATKWQSLGWFMTQMKQHCCRGRMDTMAHEEEPSMEKMVN